MKKSAAAFMAFLVFCCLAGGVFAAPSVNVFLNKTQFSAGDSMTVSFTTEPDAGGGLWDVYVAIMLPDGTLVFVKYQPSIDVSLSPLPARPLQAPVAETVKVLTITIPGDLPSGDWLWAAALARPDLREISGISLAPFTVLPPQAPLFNVAGTWSGTWASSVFSGINGAFIARVTQQGSILGGTIDIPFIGMSGSGLKGTVSGSTITFGDVADRVTFAGTVNSSETSAGTYVDTQTGDTGTWQATKSGSPGGSCVNIGGSWSITITNNSSTCDGAIPQLHKTLTMTQDGCGVSSSDGQGGTYSGILNGTQFSLTGSFPLAGGLVSINAPSMTVSADSNGINGSASWSWSDGIDTCSGTSAIAGTRF